MAQVTAYHESGFNPFAVGDGGTSFGLFQLHEGGELGNHTAAWAFHPTYNATTACEVLAQVTRKNPHLSPGEIAAAAQRPADPKGYADTVNALYTQAQTFGLGKACPSPQTFTGDDSGKQTTGDPPPSIWQDIEGAAGFGPVGNIVQTPLTDVTHGAQEAVSAASALSGIASFFTGLSGGFPRFVKLGFAVLLGVMAFYVIFHRQVNTAAATGAKTAAEAGAVAA
jgi:hypothetical protein